MKQRNLIAVIILSIVTLGIYDLYWLVATKNELNRRTDIRIPSVWILFAPVIVMVGLLIAGLVATAATHGDPNVMRLINILFILVYVIAILVMIPVGFYWLLKFSKAVNHYTNGELSTALTFLLLWLLRFIGMAIIQDKFNDMLATGPTPAAPGGGLAAPTAPQPYQAPSMQPQASTTVPPQPTPTAPAPAGQDPQQPDETPPAGPTVG